MQPLLQAGADGKATNGTGHTPYQLLQCAPALRPGACRLLRTQQQMCLCSPLTHLPLCRLDPNNAINKQPEVAALLEAAQR